jgi:hypothetical protein
VNRFLPALLACVATLSAQSWDSLQSLRPGDAVRIVDTGGKEFSGSFAAATAESLTIQSQGSARLLAKTAIRLVKVRSTSRRLRNLLIGVSVGVVTGVAVDQTLGAALRNETGDSKRPLMYLAPIALFGGIGGAIPAYRTVYRAR